MPSKLLTNETVKKRRLFVQKKNIILVKNIVGQPVFLCGNGDSDGIHSKNGQRTDFGFYHPI